MRIFAYPTRYPTRSMSLSSKCANSVTDMITQAMYSLRFVTTIRSEVPATTTFGSVSGGAERVSVKNRSENSDCMHRSVAELADLPDVAMDLVFAEVKKKIAVFLLYYTIHVKI